MTSDAEQVKLLEERIQRMESLLGNALRSMTVLLKKAEMATDPSLPESEQLAHRAFVQETLHIMLEQFGDSSS